MDGLRLIDLSKSYGTKTALRGVSFDVAQGEIVAVLGPSGCGKSTLLGLIAGLEPPDEGDILWGDVSQKNIPPHRRNFGLMFQDFALFPHLNVFDNVAFGLRMAGLEPQDRQRRVAEVLDLVGLAGFERRDVNTLSGGEQQRVALARSLAPRPRLLMLDEPLGALDRNLRERLVNDLGRILRSMRQTALYVTHDQEEAFALADRVVVMSAERGAGQVEQIGEPRALYCQPETLFVARFLGLSNLFAAKVRRSGADWIADTPLGSFPVAAQRPGSCMMLLRPDAARPGDSGHAQLEGRVAERSFRGSMLRAVIEVGGLRLTFDFLPHEALPAVGEKVRISFDPLLALTIVGWQ